MSVIYITDDAKQNLRHIWENVVPEYRKKDHFLSVHYVAHIYGKRRKLVPGIWLMPFVFP